MTQISTRTHGVVDYLFAAIAAATASQVDNAPKVQQLLTATSVAVLGYSLLTRYELGVLPLLSMRTHLSIDVVINIAAVASPAVVPSRERQASLLPVALGAIGLMVVALTDPRVGRSGAASGR